MQSDSPAVVGGAHCTLCALGIPGHVGRPVASFDDGAAGTGSTPVQVYLQRRRLGLPVALVSAER